MPCCIILTRLRASHLIIQDLGWLRAIWEVQLAVSADAVHGDALLRSQHSQRVAIDAGDDAATQICRCTVPFTLHKQQWSSRKAACRQVMSLGVRLSLNHIRWQGTIDAGDDAAAQVCRCAVPFTLHKNTLDC